jgi:hypothetical protein
MDCATVLDWHGADFDKDVSDYDRACAIDDYTGTIDVGRNKALVLGDMPSDTSVITPDPQTVLLIRWIWAENSDQVTDTINNFEIRGQEWTATGEEIEIKNSTLLLFDSSYRGTELEEKTEIPVDPGTFTISTLSYEPTPDLNLFLILLKATA